MTFEKQNFTFKTPLQNVSSKLLHKPVNSSSTCICVINKFKFTDGTGAYIQ